MAYSERQIAEALAAVRANGGNLRRTARQTGISASTLRRWQRQREGRPTDVSESERVASGCAGAAVVERRLSDRLERLAGALIGDLSDAERRQGADVRQLATALGITIDKMQLLRGEATERTETIDVDRHRIELQRKLRQAANGSAADGLA